MLQNSSGLRECAVSLLLAAACYGGNSALAQWQTNILYQDQFTGTSGALNGRTPDTVAMSGNAWRGGSAWTAGNIGGVNEATAPAGSYQDAFLPFVPVQGCVYTLSATLDDLGGDGNWLALGFTEADSYYTAAVWLQTYTSPVGWIMARPDGSTAQSTTWPARRSFPGRKTSNACIVRCQNPTV